MIPTGKPITKAYMVLDWNSSAHPGQNTPGLVVFTPEYYYLR